MPEPMSAKRLEALLADFKRIKPTYFLDSLELVAEVRRLKPFEDEVKRLEKARADCRKSLKRNQARDKATIVRLKKQAGLKEEADGTVPHLL